MFEHLFKNAPPETFVEISTLEPYPQRLYYPPSEAIARLNSPKKQSDADTPLIDVYFGVALRKSKGATKEDVFGTSVIWADIDSAAKPLYTFPPSFMVWSGGGWHLYWLLDEIITDAAAIEAANTIVAEDVRGDEACVNVNRLLRVPGTINSKYGEVLAELRWSRPEYWYNITDFVVLDALDSKARHRIRTGDSRGRPPKELTEELKGNNEDRKPNDRSVRDWRSIEELVIAGASDRLIRHLFDTMPVGNKHQDPETSPKYLGHTIDRVREKSVNVKKGKRNRAGFGDIREGPDGYYSTTSRGEFRLSTFTFEPTLLLELLKQDGTTEDILVGDVTASGFTWFDVRFPRGAFNDRKALDKYLGTTAWVWLGKDDHVRALLPFLLAKLQEKGLPRSRATSTLGRHGKFFVANHQTMDLDKVWLGSSGPLVYNPTGRETPVIEFKDGPLPDLIHLPAVNEPQVILPVLGWFAASSVKPLFEERNIRFPILNVYGTRGSGKTSVIRTAQRLFGYAKTIAYNCTTTNYVTLALLGSSNAVPVAFSEFRSAVADKFLRFVLLAYDTGHDARGRGDQTTVDYPLSAPFSVDGEDIINDSACRERIIAIALHPETIAEGTSCFEAFALLRDQPLENFAKPWFHFTLKYGGPKGSEGYHLFTDLILEASRQIHAAFPQPLPDRVRNNLIVVRVGLLMLHEFIPGGFGVDVKETFEPVLRAVWSPELGRGMTLADEFVEGIVNAVARNRSDFYSVVDQKQGVLWFQLSSALQWWLRQRRSTGQSSLEREAIRNQLLERDITRGDKGQYIHRPEVKNGRWVYGIDLRKAFGSGLDIPNELTKDSQTIWLGD